MPMLVLRFDAAIDRRRHDVAPGAIAAAAPFFFTLRCSKEFSLTPICH